MKILGSLKWKHVLNEISKNDPVYCPNQCGKYYGGLYRKYNLKEHLNYVCDGIKRFQCTICKKRFSMKNGLKQHMVLIHSILC